MSSDQPDPDLDLLLYTYTPLQTNHIRILVQDPFRKPAGLCWNIQFLDMSSTHDVKFEALSYAWGSQANSYPITLNGKRFDVHHNLYTALPFLSMRGNVQLYRPLWIDAICINQSDEEEKLQQIRLMNRIYAEANKVWVWLGLPPQQEHIPTAIGLLTGFAQAGQYVRKLEPGKRYEAQQELGEYGLKGLEGEVWATILHLIENPWCRRLWAAQEAALPDDIAFLCGAHEISLEALRGAMLAVTWLPSMNDVQGNSVRIEDTDAYVSIFWMRDVVSSRRANKPNLNPAHELMFHSFMTTGRTGCLMPEDRVFALVGLVEKENLDRSGVDFHHYYTSVSDLYTRFSSNLLTRVDKTESLWWSWLSNAFKFGRREGLPSWVPDLHNQGPEFKPKRMRVETNSPGDRPYRASKRKGNPARQGNRIEELILQGRIMDEVMEVYEEIPQVWDREDTTEHLKCIVNVTDWEERLAKLVLKDEGEVANNPNGVGKLQVTFDTYWRTMIGNFTHIHGGALTGESFLELRDAHTRLRDIIDEYNVIEKMSGGDAGAPLGIPNEMMSAFFRVAPGTPAGHLYTKLEDLEGRQLFQTADGRFGFTRTGVQKGDRVCVFHESPTIHILRKRTSGDSEGDRWQLVGDGYVHGLMYGEADEMDVEERDIVLA
ncbi:HET-domain-containing protein [Pyrenochaeta sp. DS3sAY3a]|nr:HET-domain-containing protein [Pyrenochaeta sp. DS3sAY3a]